MLTVERIRKKGSLNDLQFYVGMKRVDDTQNKTCELNRHLGVVLTIYVAKVLNKCGGNFVWSNKVETNASFCLCNVSCGTFGF